MPIRLERLNAPAKQVQREVLLYLKGVGRAVPPSHVSLYLGFTEKQASEAIEALVAERLVEKVNAGWVTLTRLGRDRLRREAAEAA